MPRSSRRIRRRPSTPNLNHLNHPSFFTADPASPPETPTSSPLFSRKSSLKPRHQPPFSEFPFSLEDDPHIKPVGNGHQFSYQPTPGLEQLSPRSSTSSSVGGGNPGDDGDDHGDESSDSESLSSLAHAPSAGRYKPFLTRQPQTDDSEADDEDEEEEEEDGDEDEEDVDDADDAEVQDGKHGRGDSEDLPFAASAAAATALWEFVIEEIDPMDTTIEALEVIYPYEVESARSRSSSWHKDAKDLDRSMMRDLKNLNCSNEASDNDEPDFDLDEDVFYKRQQELRRIRRVSMSSSVGKRTHSELSESDDDFGPLDVNDVGSSARRLRKRLHRSSLLFHDPPEQIEELEEPNSSDDEYQPAQSLAQELPYWTMEIMEMESS